MTFILKDMESEKKKLHLYVAAPAESARKSVLDRRTGNAPRAYAATGLGAYSFAQVFLLG